MGGIELQKLVLNIMFELIDYILFFRLTIGRRLVSKDLPQLDAVFLIVIANQFTDLFGAFVPLSFYRSVCILNDWTEN